MSAPAADPPLESGPTIGPGPRSGFRWNRELIAYAIDLWHRKHLEAPVQDDWERAGPDHPCRLTVLRVYGTWNTAIRAAGLEPRPRGRNRRWIRQRCPSSGRWCACEAGHGGEACGARAARDGPGKG
jgi:hypothetical protein